MHVLQSLIWIEIVLGVGAGGLGCMLGCWRRIAALCFGILQYASAKLLFID